MISLRGPKLKIIAAMLAAICLAAGIYLTFFRSRGFVKTTGTIISLREDTSGDSSVYFPTVEYSVDGKVYTGELDMRSGKELDMGSPFDLFSELSHPDSPGVTEEQYENRMLLQKAMVRNDFQPIDCEWWHFSLKNEPYPDTYFEFPVSSEYLRRQCD